MIFSIQLWWIWWLGFKNNGHFDWIVGYFQGVTTTFEYLNILWNSLNMRIRSHLITSRNCIKFNVRCSENFSLLPFSFRRIFELHWTIWNVFKHTSSNEHFQINVVRPLEQRLSVAMTNECAQLAKCLQVWCYQKRLWNSLEF